MHIIGPKCDFGTCSFYSTAEPVTCSHCLNSCPSHLPLLPKTLPISGLSSGLACYPRLTFHNPASLTKRSQFQCIKVATGWLLGHRMSCASWFPVSWGRVWFTDQLSTRRASYTITMSWIPSRDIWIKTRCPWRCYEPCWRTHSAASFGWLCLY